jgi:hypothetical protein
MQHEEMPLHAADACDEIGWTRCVGQLGPLEQQISKVHSSANSSARFYLWAGLFLLVFQLAAFIRLTFWELSWDVMEPIGFFVQLGTGIRAFPYHPPPLRLASSHSKAASPTSESERFVGSSLGTVGMVGAEERPHTQTSVI